MPTNVTLISGATQADIYLGNYAYSDILASMAALRFKLDTAGTNRLFYKNAAGVLFKVMCDASAGTNHASGRGLYTDANGAAQSSADFRFSGVLLGIGDAINGITTSHHITVGDSGAADYPQILIGKDTDNFFQVFHDNQNGYFALQQKAAGVTYSNMLVGKTGNIGVGTATPDNKLHSEVADAGTNTTVYPFKITHSSSGSPAANMGSALRWKQRRDTAQPTAILPRGCGHTGRTRQPAEGKIRRLRLTFTVTTHSSRLCSYGIMSAGCDVGRCRSGLLTT